MHAWLYPLVLFAALVAAPASAQQSLSFTAGHIGVADDLAEPQWYGIEVHFKPRTRLNLSPGFGFHRAACGANFIYADFRRPMWQGRNWGLISFFGPGVFHDSDQVNLGYDIQFRSGMDLSYRFDGGTRIAVGVSHLSNASLGRLNPGTEVVSVSYSMPLS